MKRMFQAVAVAVAVLALPALSLAAQTTPATATTKTNGAAKPTSATVYSAHGVVKSIDASSLVLTEKPSKKKSHDVKFVLDSSTQKDPKVAAGSTVKVKYHNDAKHHVATEIREASGKKS
jgi:hypothetical protein